MVKPEGWYKCLIGSQVTVTRELFAPVLMPPTEDLQFHPKERQL